MPRINKKRPTSSKKKKKKSNNKNNNNSTTNKNAAPSPPLNLNQILSQADVAYETSNTEQALQLYAHAQTILQQQIQNLIQQQFTTNNNEIVSKIMTCAKVSCKIGEIKVSFHDPNDNGYNDFMNGIQLLSQENEQKYITTASTSTGSIMMAAAQWKEARANLFLYLGQLSCEKDALNSFTNAIHDLKACISILEQSAATSNNNNNSNNSSMNSPTMVSDNTTTTSDDEKAMNDNIQSTLLFETQKSLCGAYCSIAELYLTDLCFEVNAEQECEQSLTLALELDQIIKKQLEQRQQSSSSSGSSSSTDSYVPDAVQAMANLRLCQNRPLEAIPYIVDAYNRMKVGCEALSNLVGLKQQQHQDNENTKQTAVGGSVGDDQELATELKGEALDAANSLPGFEFRCQTAKILLECAANLEQQQNNNDSGGANKIENIHEQRIYCIEAAIHTLGSLLAENDEVIETWYLLGCAFQSKSVNDHEASKYYFENALQMLMKTKEQLQEQSGDEMMDGAESGDGDGHDGMMNPLQDIDEKIEDVKMKISQIEENTSSQMDED